MLTGALVSKGILVDERKVGKILKDINWNARKAREYSVGKRLNPKVYKADYFGHKIHYDQNDKLGMYKVVHASVYKNVHPILHQFSYFLKIKN